METKIFTVTFLSETNVYRQVSGKQLLPEETLSGFITDRAIPCLRGNPLSKEELIGGYKICVGSELLITNTEQEIKQEQTTTAVPNTQEVKTIESVKTIEVNKMNNPVFVLRYLRDKYCAKKDKEVFNRIIEKLEKNKTKSK